MTRSTCILLVLLTLMSVLSLFVGAADITPADVLSGDIESLELMLISRLPRLLAILCLQVVKRSLKAQKRSRHFS